MTRKHALIIGGTGMLKGVSLWLTELGFKISVIGRSERKHLDLEKRSGNPGLINHMMLDYNDHSKLEKEMRSVIEKDGPISIVVSWTPSLSALELVSNVVSERSSEWKLYQIKGSRRFFEDDRLTISTNCKHRSIYLGFVIENHQSRWLSNTEIAEGVITSIEEDRTESIIGRLHPYEDRPR